jgi:tetratricopeptide (TPR) repeat protein
MQAVVKEKGFNWPQYFDGLGWDNRIAKAWGVTSIPQTFIISPTGDVLWRGHPAGIDEPLKTAMREHPPQLVDPQTAAAANQTLDKVEAATAASHFADALSLLGQFPSGARADPKIAAREDKDTHRLQAAADAVLANTDTLVAQKHYTEAATALKALVDSMAGTDEGKKAQESLNNLRANPAAAAALAAAAREDSANAVLQTAQKLQAAKRDRQAYISYNSVLKQFPGTAAAATAALAIKAYDADPAFADRSAKAHSALNLAMNYLNAGQTDTAREKFQDVIDRFPGTPEADTAKDELAKLSG